MNIELLRQFRIGPFAVFDFAASFLGIYLLAPLLVKLSTKAKFSISKVQWLWLVIPLSILFHIIFDNITPLTAMIVDINGYYIEKAIILFMLYMGLKRK